MTSTNIIGKEKKTVSTGVVTIIGSLLTLIYNIIQVIF